MPRTTLDLDASVLAELRRRSQQEGKSLGRVVSELLAPALAQRSGDGEDTFNWIARDLGRPLVDLEDRDAVEAVLDGRR